MTNNTPTLCVCLVCAAPQGEERERFYGMDWKESYEAPGEADSCVILGEETVPNGKVWYVCSEKADDPSMDCSPVDGWGSPTLAAGGGEWLCKQDRPMASQKKPWNFWQKK